MEKKLTSNSERVVVSVLEESALCDCERDLTSVVAVELHPRTSLNWVLVLQHNFQGH